MVKVPLLAGPTFGATANPTEPLSTPLAPEEIEIQGELLVEFQLQPPLPVTETLPDTPAELTFEIVDGLSVT